MTGGPRLTLWQFAVRVAGPRDAVINLVLNLLIPWLVLRGIATVPLCGLPSVEVFLGAMGLMLFTMATYFGIMNGVIMRTNGWAGKPLAATVHWRGWALRTGLVYGVTAGTCFVVVIRAVHAWNPDLHLSSTTMIVLMASLSAVLGFAVQVHGVMMSARL